MVAVLAWLLASEVNLYPHVRFSDVPVYDQMARRMAEGAIPFRDFDIEYPPLAVCLIWLADRLPGAFAGGFSLLMLLASLLSTLGAAAAAGALHLGERRLVVGFTVALSPLLLGDFVQTRFDLALTALLAWTMWAAIEHRWTLAWALLSGAIAMKLVPFVVVPPLFLLHRHHCGPVKAVRASGLTLLGAAGTFLPFLVLSPTGVWHIFSYHLQRPLQLESAGASALLVVGHFVNLRLRVETTFGSPNLFGTGTKLLSALATLLALAGLTAMLMRTARAMMATGEPTATVSSETVFVAGAAAILSIALVFGKVLSPQYLLWLLPTTMLVEGRRGRIACTLTVCALIATQAYFPSRMAAIQNFDLLPIIILACRNALLVALTAFLWSATRPLPTRS